MIPPGVSTGGFLFEINCYPQILARLAQGSTRALVDSVLPLADAAKAHQRIDDRSAIGKIVLMP
jgi:NADPH2:quinone reductase